MGQDFAPAPDAASSSHAQTQTSAQAPATPGKATLAQQQQAGVDSGTLAMIEGLQLCAGMKIKDGGGFIYEVQSQGTFVITIAPPDYPQSVNATIGLTHAAWMTLAILALTEPSAIVSGAPPELFDDEKTEPKAPKPEQPKPEQPKPDKPKPEPPRVRGAAKAGYAVRPDVVASVKVNPKETHEVYQLDSKTFGAMTVGDIGALTCDAKLVSPEHPFERDPAAILKEASFVRVLEIDPAKGIARVEKLAKPTAPSGQEFGWIRAGKILREHHAPRQTSASAQMSALLAAAEAANGGNGKGTCYAFVKNYIALAGGYGDIADVRTDARFAQSQGPAVGFAACVRSLGAAELGLTEVTGDVASAQPGTLLVTLGNGIPPKQGGSGISTSDGDIAVIAGVVGNYVRCINDGIMLVPKDPKVWSAGNPFENTLVGMFKPVDRK